jgi:hypothetical protein
VTPRPNPYPDQANGIGENTMSIKSTLMDDALDSTYCVH